MQELSHEQLKAAIKEVWIRSLTDLPSDVEKALAKLEDKIFLSKCHTIRYPNIKRWFLYEYPEVAKFGTNAVEETEKTNVIAFEETNKAA